MLDMGGSNGVVGNAAARTAEKRRERNWEQEHAEHERSRKRERAGYRATLLEHVHTIENARDEVALLLAQNRAGWRRVAALRKSLTHGNVAAWHHSRLHGSLLDCLRQDDFGDRDFSHALMHIHETCEAILAAASDPPCMIGSEGIGPLVDVACEEADRLGALCYCLEDAPMAPQEEYDAFFASATTLCAIIRASVESDEEETKQ